MSVVPIEDEHVGSDQYAPVTKTRAFDHVPDQFGNVVPKKSTGTTGNQSDLSNTSRNT